MSLPKSRMVSSLINNVQACSVKECSRCTIFNWKFVKSFLTDGLFCNRYQPVFHEWFIETFPEPTAWLASRLTYGRTAAVMSIVGFILGYVILKT